MIRVDNKTGKDCKNKMKKKILACILMSTMVIGSIVGCGSSDKEETVSSSLVDSIKAETTAESEAQAETDSEAEETEETREGMYRSELTNEWIDESLKNQRPIAAMVDNEKTALPHYGLGEADVVYELMNSTANDRITRLMVLVKDWGSIKQLGSIRSVRPTNILLAAEWNAVLCHDGGPFYIDPYLANDYAAHFSGTFSRVDNGKSREFTEYIVSGDLDKNFSNSKYSTEYDKYYPGEHYQFSNSELDLSGESGAIDATEISLPFKHNGSTLKYNSSTQTYDYYEYGSVHKDAEDGDVLTFKNLLIQKCSFHQYDENGYMIYNCEATDQDGYYVTNGKAIPVKWSKVGDTGITTYFGADGKEIEINTGKTYVTLVPDDGWKNMTIK